MAKHVVSRIDTAKENADTTRRYFENTAGFKSLNLVEFSIVSDTKLVLRGLPNDSYGTSKSN